MIHIYAMFNRKFEIIFNVVYITLFKVFEVFIIYID